MKKIIFILNSSLIFLCLISLFGGLVYRVYSLNFKGIIISLTLAVISFIIIQYYYYYANKKNQPVACRLINQTKNPELKQGFSFVNLLLLLAYGLVILSCFYILLNHRTDEAIISPWQAVPSYFFISFSLASLLLLANIIKNRKIALFLIIIHYFLSFSVALIVYRLGYGFDPFVHQATENLIDKIGAVEPKPLYYLGQYSLVVILHKITALSLVWLDRLLVPLLAAIFLPLALWQAVNHWFTDKRLNLILIFSLLALTFPFLIVTTPQNLAYILLIIIILLGLICKNHYDFLIILLLSLTALIIQPIAGLPAIIFCLLLAVYHGDKSRIKLFLYPFLLIISVLILPIIFFVLNKKISSAAANLIAPAVDSAGFGVPGQENFILNFIYLYGFNLKLILLLLVAGGLVIAWKFKENCRIFFLYLAMSLSLFISYFLTDKIPFAFLINYERGDYSERILLIALLFLLPFIIISIYAFLEKVFSQNIFYKLILAACLVILITTSLYLTYPRFDNYFNSRGYSVSGADLESVDWINSSAKGDFIVLANQQVSAAALSRFGFKKYYGDGRNQLFYYPIPTGSPLYQFYLDMVYKQPSRVTMLEAMGLAGVDEAYFVLNQYWWAFSKILAEAKLSADSFEVIKNGEVYVFKYLR